ncbi:gluconokinase [Corallincola platygyrae]|uniref:Gluconokinase n=1 Tax=Corallincola platygyrae TaxID=1193278 RepID=A0ABW4XK72_9GAMM
MKKGQVVLLMGVSGCGKTTIGRMLSEKLGWRYYDGDVFHSPTNIAKMRRGEALTDHDRAGWLETLRQLIHDKIQSGDNAIISCSTLKREYRKLLCSNNPELRLLFLKGDYATILPRFKNRKGHFFTDETLLHNQFEVLEEPSANEAIAIDIDKTAEQVTEDCLDAVREFKKAS